MSFRRFFLLGLILGWGFAPAIASAVTNLPTLLVSTGYQRGTTAKIYRKPHRYQAGIIPAQRGLSRSSGTTRRIGILRVPGALPHRWARRLGPTAYERACASNRRIPLWRLGGGLGRWMEGWASKSRRPPPSPPRRHMRGREEVAEAPAADAE
jgi:hypothetical protein